MHAQSDTTSQTASIDGISATTARIKLMLPNNVSVNGTTASFLITWMPTGIVGELSRNGTTNTLASCLVENTGNNVLTLPETSTSATLTHLSMWITAHS